MVTSTYMNNRKIHARPQAFIFSNNSGFLDEETGAIIPEGQELSDFIVLSDDNRSPIGVNYERIETRVRTINGRMRSYHIADKLKIDMSWDMLPSRSFALDNIRFSEDGLAEVPPDSLFDPPRAVRKPGAPNLPDESFTTDRGAGGAELLQWYEDHPSSFWVFMSYDKYTNFDSNTKSRLGEYSDVVEMFFADFQYSVEKRGGSNFDFWNVSLSLEEV
jgi:hypothetical protein